MHVHCTKCKVHSYCMYKVSFIATYNEGKQWHSQTQQVGRAQPGPTYNRPIYL